MLSEPSVRLRSSQKVQPFTPFIISFASWEGRPSHRDQVSEVALNGAAMDQSMQRALADLEQLQKVRGGGIVVGGGGG